MPTDGAENVNYRLLDFVIGGIHRGILQCHHLKWMHRWQECKFSLQKWKSHLHPSLRECYLFKITQKSNDTTIPERNRAWKSTAFQFRIFIFQMFNKTSYYKKDCVKLTSSSRNRLFHGMCQNISLRFCISSR